jgi:hypothetical protein
MSLPALQGDGCLPVNPNARHPALPSEVERLFVTGAPSHKDLRADIWRAYELWSRRVVHHFGHGQAWLAGTFVTHLVREPFLRVAFFPTTPRMVGDAIRRGDVGLGLLTVEDVFFMSPAPGGSVELVRAVGGMIDSQVGSMSQSDGWDAMWSLLGDPRSRQHSSAGYVSLPV